MVNSSGSCLSEYYWSRMALVFGAYYKADTARSCVWCSDPAQSVYYDRPESEYSEFIEHHQLLPIAAMLSPSETYGGGAAFAKRMYILSKLKRVGSLVRGTITKLYGARNILHEIRPCLGARAFTSQRSLDSLRTASDAKQMIARAKRLLVKARLEIDEAQSVLDETILERRMLMSGLDMTTPDSEKRLCDVETAGQTLIDAGYEYVDWVFTDADVLLALCDAKLSCDSGIHLVDIRMLADQLVEALSSMGIRMAGVLGLNAHSFGVRAPSLSSKEDEGFSYEPEEGQTPNWIQESIDEYYERHPEERLKMLERKASLDQAIARRDATFARHAQAKTQFQFLVNNLRLVLNECDMSVLLAIREIACGS